MIETIKLLAMLILGIGSLPVGFYFVGRGIDGGSDWNMLWAILAPCAMTVAFLEVLRVM